MIIPVTTSKGVGTTELGAFDAALYNAGVANTNLVRLSSVIPPGTKIVKHDAPIEGVPGEWGDRLHVVYADSRTSKVGQEVWAGIGWVQDPDDGRGLFVEHEGNSEDEVATLIEKSLKQLAKNRGMEFPEMHSIISGTRCTESGMAVCAFAVAVYQASDWQNKPFLWEGN